MTHPDAPVPPMALLAAREYERLCIGHAVRRVARALSRRYEEALRPLDLTTGQFSILAALARPHGVRLTRLALDLGMDRTTLSRDIKPLEKRGLVETGKDPEDARARLVTLSGPGRNLLAKATPLWQQAQAGSLERIGGPEAWEEARALLDKLSPPFQEDLSVMPEEEVSPQPRAAYLSK